MGTDENQSGMRPAVWLRPLEEVLSSGQIAILPGETRRQGRPLASSRLLRRERWQPGPQRGCGSLWGLSGASCAELPAPQMLIAYR